MRVIEASCFHGGNALHGKVAPQTNAFGSSASVTFHALKWFVASFAPTEISFQLSTRFACLEESDEFFRALGQRIRDLRIEGGYSQEDTISFGFSARHWQQIEGSGRLALLPASWYVVVRIMRLRSIHCYCSGYEGLSALHRVSG